MSFDDFKISSNDVEDILPLSPLQEGILFEYQTSNNKELYFEQLRVSLSGKFNKRAFTETWEKVLSYNPALRSIFRWNNLDKPIQIVLKCKELMIHELDLSGIKEQQSIKLEKLLKEERQKGIKLQSQPFYLTLCKLDDEKYEMVLNFHHILFDGWSTSIIISEFLTIYEAIVNNREYSIPFKNGYKDYLRSIQNRDTNAEREYWNNYLSGYGIKEIMLQNDEGMKSDNLPQSCEYIVEFPEQFINKMKKLSLEHQFTLANFFYTAWGLLVRRYVGDNDIVFGTTVSNRSEAIRDIDKLVGLFINTLPLRFNLNEKLTVIDAIHTVSENTRKREKFLSTPLFEIKKYCGIDMKASLFDTNIVIENYPIFNNKESVENSIKVDSFNMHESVNFKLMVEVIIFEGLQIKFLYNQNQINSNEIEMIAGHFKQLITNMVENPELDFNEIDILTEKEKTFLLSSVQKQVSTDNFTINQLIDKSITNNFNKTAIIFEDKELTYQELDTKLKNLSNVLIRKKIEREEVIGVFLNRSIETIVSILAILKVGGAFLPIDPNLPHNRVVAMLKQSKARKVITVKELAGELPAFAETIDLSDSELYRNSVNDEFEVEINPGSLAYVYFTSGSTGTPKGIMIEHRNIANFLEGFASEISLSDCSKILSVTSISFDPFLVESLLALSQGKTCVLANYEQSVDPEMLKSLVKKHEVDLMQLTPSRLLNLIYDEECQDWMKSIKVLLVGGEKFDKKIIEILDGKISAKIYNLYGPTETTVWSTAYEIKEGDIKIGKPINNVNYFIVNPLNYKQLQPIGLKGEICITGSGTGRGYINSPELTKAAFVEDIFSNNQIMYKTGDIAIQFPDKTMKYLSRNDNQVKIRGYRIELNEIENVLFQSKQVKTTAVTIYTDHKHEPSICVYYVPSTNKVTDSTIKEELEKWLPYYMIPTYFISLKEMPINNNGKINRQKLPKPNVKTSEMDRNIKPQSKLQSQLVRIWSEVLERNDITINDNFFELGGHSLLASRIAIKIREQLKVNIPITQLFKDDTIRSLAEYIEENFVEKQEEDNKEGAKSLGNKHIASSSQKRMYILHQIDNAQTAYNLPAIYKIEGQLNKERLELAVNELVKRHEILKSFFLREENNVYQVTSENPISPIEYEKVENLKIDKAYLDFIKPFDLSKAPLWRIKVITVNEDEQWLLFDMHHIISDGTSLNLLVKEFLLLYQDGKTNENGVQYREYALNQQERLLNDSYKQQENYWLKKLEGKIPVLQLPTDYTRPIKQSFEGERIKFDISDELVVKLKEYARIHRFTLFNILLGTFNILISKYTGRSDIIVGTPISGRLSSRYDNTLGMFVNTLPLRSFPNKEKNINEYLEELKLVISEAIENQEYPFEEMINQINLQRDTSRNALFDVMFSFQSSVNQELNIPGMKINKVEQTHKHSKCDVTLEVLQRGVNFEVMFEYCSGIFKKDTIMRMYDHFINILEQICSGKNLDINSLELTTLKERNMILEHFNKLEKNYPETSICSLFELQARKNPDKIAIIYKNQHYSYSEINEKANQIARFLQKQGVKSGEVVALMLERSPLMFIGIMAVLKMGAAYLPLQPEPLTERSKYILKDSNAKIILTQDKLIPYTEEYCTMSIEDSVINFEETTDLKNVIHLEQLAYLMYTSGSTGTPKGVLIRHKSISNLLFGLEEMYPLKRAAAFLLKTNYIFDVSIPEMFGWFINEPGRLVILEHNKEVDSAEILNEIRKNKVTHINFVPSMLDIFLRYVKKYREPNGLSLKYIFVAGETFNKELAKSCLNIFPNVCLENLYGPTETTVYATGYSIKSSNMLNSAIPIGKPLHNIKALIINETGKLQPVGIPGELCIGGKGLAVGYLNKPKLNNENFIKEMFGIGSFYRTGDLAKWDEEGNVIFLGRKDHQVKLRGYRIELGEIESKMLEFKPIEQVVVIKKNNQGEEDYLVAYLKSKTKTSIVELRAFLQKYLPYYMIPSYFIQLEDFPVLPSGKIDRSALPNPSAVYHKETKEIDNSLNEEQAFIKQIWSSILKNDLIGIDDNFFEIGGSSLGVIRMFEYIDEKYPGKLTVADIFSYKTIKAIAEKLSEKIQTNSRRNLDTLYLPEHYFVSGDSYEAKQRITKNIDSNIGEQLAYLSRNYNFSVENFYLSVYTYLLSQVIKKSIFSVYILENNEELREMEVDLSNITDIFDLVNYFEKNSYKDIGIDQIREVQRLYKNIEVGEFVPLFSYQPKNDRVLLENFDLVIGCHQSENNFKVECIFDNNILKGEKVKLLIDNYCKFVEASLSLIRS
ncbi:hypothetical protein COL63_21810 [Bacillus pseudomycoides]|uniref:non-ribosomal peptide synthetase n=1 Tax=Bacillus pseudomycoides TaxID=64104 RepID=UPI000BF8D62D|nr:non-ribosomal peptide synthetase [Bacillus pseudomycoides]PFZ09662.1 hypothetical protein COL63_21810 [Bacillus pseudomycoides]